MIKRPIFRKRDRVEDLFETHAFELAMSWSLFFFGVRALLTGLQTAPGSVQELPTWLAITYCALASIGGLSVILGIWFHDKFGWAYGLELMGLILSASAWASYIIGISMMPITGKSTLLILAILALVVGCVLRARAVARRARATMESLRHATPSKEE